MTSASARPWWPPRVRVTTAPAYEPLTLAEAKTHLRVTGTADDTYITGLISVAREYVERVQGRAFITQGLTATFDAWPCDSRLVLPRAPLASVTSVTYTPKATGTPVTLSSSNYLVDSVSEPGAIVRKREYTWPSDELVEVNAISVVYTAGYGVAAGPAAGPPASMPWSIYQALKFLVGHLYERREPLSDKPVFDVPRTLTALITMERVGWFA